MDTLAFVGGGNMAGAIVGGLVRSGRAPHSIVVVDPNDAQRERLHAELGVRVLPAADETLEEAALVVWAVKPQYFQAAALPCAPYVDRALQLSVMAGIRSDAIALAAGTQRVVRAMPNTPALIGAGHRGSVPRPA
jgi:pyrroline-5-carboxylate reductase